MLGKMFEVAIVFPLWNFLLSIICLTEFELVSQIFFSRRVSITVLLKKDILPKSKRGRIKRNCYASKNVFNQKKTKKEKKL